MIAVIPAPPEWVMAAAMVIFVIFLLSIVLVLIRLALERWAGWGDSEFENLGEALLLALFTAMALSVLSSAIANSAERTLTFTLPLTTAKANASGQIVDCSGGAPVNSLAGWRLYAQIQSPTYATRSRAMLGSADEWARWWPVCAAEAMPRQVRSASSKHMPNGGAGQRVTVSAPDSLDGMPVLAYFVTTFNDSGKVSCPSSTINH